MSDDFWSNIASHLEASPPKQVQAFYDAPPVDIAGIDLTRPPGLVGEVAAWMESRSRRPRRHIAVAGALSAVGNIAGLRHIDTHDGITTNLFIFCVAGSRTGKESIQQSVALVHKAVGFTGATHGSIKSEQEIIRNLVRHQSALYVIDEIGILLEKIRNAQKRGGASYLDGVIGLLMSAYSKANDFMLLTGDVKEALRADMVRDLSRLSKQLNDGDGGSAEEARISSIKQALSTFDSGLERPFLSMIGFTTPVTFDELADYQSATNGFIGRAIIFNERDTAPRSKAGFTQPPGLPDHLAMRLAQIAHGGTFDASPGRIEYQGERVGVDTDDDAKAALRSVLDWVEDQAIQQRDSGGLEALWLGAYELVAKISFILGVADGGRNAAHVAWAFALVRRDIEDKIRLVIGNDVGADRVEASVVHSALRARIEALTSGDDAIAAGTIINRIRIKGCDRSRIEREIGDMVDCGLLIEDVAAHPRNGAQIRKYRLVR